jgi:transposase
MGGRRWLAELELPLDERLTLDGCLRQIDFLDQEVAAFDSEIAKRALEWPEVLRLMSIPGVNVQTAAAFMAAVGDAERELSRQAEIAYRRLVSDWRSSGRPKSGAGHDTGARISEPSKGKAARQTP